MANLNALPPQIEDTGLHLADDEGLSLDLSEFDADLQMPVVHEEGAFDSFLEPEAPDDGQMVAEREAAMASYYLDPEGTARYREMDGLQPVDPADFEDWASKLSEADRAELEAEKQAKSDQAQLKLKVHEKLSNSVPELYRGALPAVLAGRLDGAPYSVGFNQTVETLPEAQGYLLEQGGIDVTGYDYHHRFMMFDSSMAKDGEPSAANTKAVDEGYYGRPSMGRFVVAFPAVNPGSAEGDIGATRLVTDHKEALPNDFEVDTPLDGGPHRAVNSKYVAGFIDEEGDFWMNTNFSVSAEPSFAKYVPEAQSEAVAADIV